jgi:hypothetical protein
MTFVRYVHAARRMPHAERDRLIAVASAHVRTGAVANLRLAVFSGVIGAPEKDPGAPAVELTGALALTAAPVLVLEQAGKVTTGHLADRALAQRVDAEREEITAAKENGKEK